VYNIAEMASLDIVNGQKLIADDEKHGHAKYIIAMAVEIILLYVLNNLLHNYITALAPYVSNTYPRFIVSIVDTLASWHIPYFTDDCTSCLWAVNTALGVAIIANLALLLYHPKWFHHLIKGVIFGLAALPTYVVFKIFPFIFSSNGPASATKVILIIILAGMAIGFVIEIVLFILALIHKIKNNKEEVRQRQEPVTPAADQISQEPSEQLSKDQPEPGGSQ
jgi:hypothetical protein